MTEPMSREEADWAMLEFGVSRRAVDALRDLAKSRPIDLGDGVMVARLEQVGWATKLGKEPVYRIRTDQPAAEEPAP
jgi:hypothetical protein